MPAPATYSSGIFGGNGSKREGVGQGTGVGRQQATAVTVRCEEDIKTPHHQESCWGGRTDQIGRVPLAGREQRLAPVLLQTQMPAVQLEVLSRAVPAVAVAAAEDALSQTRKHVLPGSNAPCPAMPPRPILVAATAAHCLKARFISVMYYQK